MRRIALLAAALAFAACGDSSTQPKESTGPLRVKTELSSSAFKEGSAVGYTITVTNTSTDSITLNLGCGNALVSIRWKNQEVYPGNVFCLGFIGVKPPTVAPGENYVAQGSWRGEANLPTGSGTVPPGTYSIQGQASYRAADGTFKQAYGAVLPVTMVP